MKEKVESINDIQSPEFEEQVFDDGFDDSPKFKIHDGPDTLPIGFYSPEEGRYYRGYELQGLNADVLSSFEQEQNPFRTFGSMVAKGLTKIFDKESGEEAPGWKDKSSKLFFPDTFFLLVEILVKTKGTSLVPTVYRCPQCQALTKFENPMGAGSGADGETGFALDTSDDELSSLEMEDIRSLPFNTYHDVTEPELTFSFKNGVVVDGEKLTEYTFRIPEIGDYILKSSAKASKDGERKVLFHCLKSINGYKDKDLTLLKTKQGISLLNLPLVEYTEILRKINSIGYDYQSHRTTCASCGNEYKTTFDLSNFFGSLLRR